MKQKSLSIPQSPVRTVKIYRLAVEVICAILLIVWLYTGTSKLIEYYDFRFQLRKLPYFSQYAPFLTFFIPLLEIAIALLLIVKKTKLLGLIASLGLMLIFTAHVYYVLNYMRNIPCSCGGVISSLDWHQHLTLNIVLTLLALIALIIQLRLNKWTKGK
ncbi:MauE/DoxX family redox-associated membrane protein [Chitinophaga sp. XS-30]|uniref:MauE/DoxX family redox-associated membrane protein n=1 Tax=Chitinophaga sp. XS-30 TaxID=2604421 RepID=UPI0011DD55F8|nr:hypothetical protein FW415_00630 [Chitinophaga sp. XS-30]